MNFLDFLSNEAKLFEYLLELSLEKNFTLVIDEFQEFLSINSTIYSDMQNLWDFRNLTISPTQILKSFH